MRKFGLIGKKLTHSFSKKYFTEKFENENINDAIYNLYELSTIDEIVDLLKNEKIIGLNVTIPYKTEVLPFLNSLDESAKLVGAVNVILNKENKLIGYNSDFYGFKNSLSNWYAQHGSALVLGSGGASKAVSAVLKTLEIPYKIVSRSKGDLTYPDLYETPSIVSNSSLIINTTPLGMFPNTNDLPDLPYDLIGGNHYLYDLVYNPEVTEFMKRGIAQKASVKNGLEMLELQAEKSWEIWNS